MYNTSKVYIKTDGDNRIIRCEGGYTMQNIEDVTQWIYIDEGEGDKYNLCQSHYFDGGLYTEDSIARWKYVDGTCVLRTVDEIEADRAARPAPVPMVTIPAVEYESMVTQNAEYEQALTDIETALGV